MINNSDLSIPACVVRSIEVADSVFWLSVIVALASLFSLPAASPSWGALSSLPAFGLMASCAWFIFWSLALGARLPFAAVFLRYVAALVVSVSCAFLVGPPLLWLGIAFIPILAQLAWLCLHFYAVIRASEQEPDEA